MNRRALGFLVSISLFAGRTLGARAEEGLDRAASERQILIGPAKGQDVAPQIEFYLNDEDAARQAPRLQSQVGRELCDTLVAFEQALPRTESGLPWTLAAYDVLRGADLLMRDHFRGIAEKSEEDGIGGEILARLQAAESRYLERIERIHAAAAPLR